MRILSNLPLKINSTSQLISFGDLDPLFDKRPVLIRELLDRCAVGWRPDVLVFSSPLYLPIPEDLDDAPMPTVLLLDDWFGGIDYLMDHIRRFDFIFTDKATVKLLQAQGIDTVDYWPCFGYNPLLFKKYSSMERDIDVSFTGNLNRSIQGERLPWLRRLAIIDPKYSVRMESGIFGEAYVETLNRSKIVFDKSIKGEMNMRAFEAPACGALLFLEDTNLEVADFFEPGAECILYNDDNFEDLLRYYIDNKEACRRIAEAGYLRAQGYSYPDLFDRLVRQIDALQIVPKQRRDTVPRYHAGLQHRTLVQHVFTKGTIQPAEIIASVSDVMLKSAGDPYALNDCGVILATLADLTQDSAGSVEKSSYLGYSLNLFDSVLAHMPDFLPAQFNRAQLLVKTGHATEAMGVFEKILAETQPATPALYYGLVYPFTYAFPLRSYWCMAFSESQDGSADSPQRLAVARHRILRFFSAFLLGVISERHEQNAAALTYYNAACEIFPDDAYVLERILLNPDATSHPDYKSIARRSRGVNAFCWELWKREVASLRTRPDADSAVDLRSLLDECQLIIQRTNLYSPEIVSQIFGNSDINSGILK